MQHAILIAGPTASGKSSLAIKLARALGGVIINADSMQVYRDLRVITARPNAQEEAEAPHRLYGTLDGAAVCSAAEWAATAMQEVQRAWDEGLYPILVGGTGMYFKVLVDGIATVPDIAEDVRAQVRAEITEKGSAALHSELENYDPVTAARLYPGDSQRIARAVEVFRSTGIPLSDHHKNHTPGLLKDAAQTRLVLNWPREMLYDRCNRRFDMMLDEGGLEEVRALLDRDLPADKPVMKALGVPTLARYLRGESGMEDAVEASKMQTRRFAKRQMTWFRNQFSHWKTINTQQMESKIPEILQNISKNKVD